MNSLKSVVKDEESYPDDNVLSSTEAEGSKESEDTKQLPKDQINPLNVGKDEHFSTEENDELHRDLHKAFEEIDKLRCELKDKEFMILAIQSYTEHRVETLRRKIACKDAKIDELELGICVIKAFINAKP